MGAHTYFSFEKANSEQILHKAVWFGLVWFHGISTFVGYLTPNPFSGDIHASPRNNQNHKLTVSSAFLFSNSKHDFCYTMANISPSHIQQCLYLTMHFSLRHLAAKMLSPLSHNFISFPYFFLSYETCNININPLFYAAIKNLHIKANGIFVFLFVHPPLFYNNT